MSWTEMPRLRYALSSAPGSVSGRHCLAAAAFVAGVLAAVSLTGCDEQERSTSSDDRQSQSAGEDKYQGLEWSKNRITSDDGREYLLVQLNEERLRIPWRYVTASPDRPHTEAMVAWTWPGLRSKEAFHQLDENDQRFSVIRVLFQSSRRPTPFHDTVHYLRNQRDDGAVVDVANWGPNPNLLRHQVRGHMAYYELRNEELRLPSGNPVIASCSWLREEGDGSCEVTMQWSEEVGVQYRFTDHDLLKELVPVHRAVTDFIESVHEDKE